MKCRMCTTDDNFWHVVEKLPAGCHSTKGVGRTEPDPATVKEIDGAKVYQNSTFSCFCDLFNYLKNVLFAFFSP